MIKFGYELSESYSLLFTSELLVANVIPFYAHRARCTMAYEILVHTALQTSKMDLNVITRYVTIHNRP